MGGYRGHERRWCGMAACGNRAKAVAYRARGADAAVTASTRPSRSRATRELVLESCDVEPHLPGVSGQRRRVQLLLMPKRPGRASPRTAPALPRPPRPPAHVSIGRDYSSWVEVTGGVTGGRQRGRQPTRRSASGTAGTNAAITRWDLVPATPIAYVRSLLAAHLTPITQRWYATPAHFPRPRRPAASRLLPRDERRARGD